MKKINTLEEFVMDKVRADAETELQRVVGRCAYDISEGIMGYDLDFDCHEELLNFVKGLIFNNENNAKTYEGYIQANYQYKVDLMIKKAIE